MAMAQSQLQMLGAPMPRQPQPGGPIRSWHTEADVEERRALMQQIFEIFQQRRPTAMTQWNQRLPDFVKRLEEALYRTAGSKEEYLDAATLETRLQDVARRFVTNRPASQPQAGPGPGSAGASVNGGQPQQQRQPGAAQPGAPPPGMPQAGTPQLPGQPSTQMGHHGPTSSSPQGGANAPGTNTSGGAMLPQQQFGGGGGGAQFNDPFGVGVSGLGGGNMPFPGNMGMLGGSGGGPGAHLGGILDAEASGHNNVGMLGAGGTGGANNIIGSPGMLGDSGAAGISGMNTAGGQQQQQQQQHGMVQMPSGMVPTAGSGGGPNSMISANDLMPSGGANGMVPTPGTGTMMTSNDMGPTTGMGGGGMVPLGGNNNTAAGGGGDNGTLPSTSQQQHSANNFSLPGGGSSGGALMSNGAPIMLRHNAPTIKQEWPPANNIKQEWPATGLQGAFTGGALPHDASGLMSGMNMGSTYGLDDFPGMVPASGFGATTTTGPSKVNNGMLGHGAGMIPTGAMMPTSGMGGMGGMIPTGGPSGMVPMGGMDGMMPTGGGAGGLGAAGGTMMPNNANGFPMASGMMPSGGGGGMGAAGGQADSAAPSSGTASLPGVSDRMTDESRKLNVQKQQRWLLFLRHCAKCRHNEQECQLKSQCKFGKQLWSHILQCGDSSCEYPRCTTSKELLKHHQKCSSEQCPICAPVKDYVKKTRLHQQHLNGPPGGGGHAQHNPGLVPGNMNNLNGGMQNGGLGNDAMLMNGGHRVRRVSGSGQVMPSSQLIGTKRNFGAMSTLGGAAAGGGAGGGGAFNGDAMHGMMPVPGGAATGMMPVSGTGMMPVTGVSGMVPVSGTGMMPVSGTGMMPVSATGMMPVGPSSGGGGGVGVGGMMPLVGGMGGMMPVSGGGSAMVSGGGGGNMPVSTLPDESPVTVVVPKRAKSDSSILAQNTGTSLIETFTAEQIRGHLEQVRAAAAVARTTQAPPLNPNDACKVCGMTKLSYDPPVIYCSYCGMKIKRGQVFYCTLQETGATDAKGSFCHTCYTDQKGDRIALEGTGIKKSDLTKKKNDESIEEGWVQCDQCEGWVHMLCGMFNKGRNNNDVHYLCPECLLLGLETGQRPRIEVRPQSMLEAKDLGTTRLSDYLELRLSQQLSMERRQRAALLGKMPHEVPAVEPLTVRVINNVMKKCEVKGKFYETFASEGVPYDFPYRQKVVLLFQNLDGVDVCLFVMYVQEYGDTCPAPNRNTVYLSYLDSIKYFRPEVNVAGQNNVSLRTFVYHQLLIGYLSYVKMLGFEQMFIWACPPMQGDDYILHCHPPKQKTPRSDRLRAWYLDMLKQAKNEGIVTHLTTLWDTYFEGGRDHRRDHCSSTHIPYLEGDYWPGEAENQLATLNDPSKGGQKAIKKGAGALGRKPAGKGARHGGGPATTDEQLMSRLGDILGGSMKEDFIVVHLQEVCTFCRGHPAGGANLYRYVAPSGARGPSLQTHERRFEGIKLEGGGPSVPAGPVTQLTICEPCRAEEERRLSEGQKSRLPGSVSPSELVAQKVERLERLLDLDPDLESEFFETRQSFLSLCQGNHFQFDSLRRAKHSSMMVLYHLHNPSAPAFTTTCNMCNAEIEPGGGFRCTVCSDYDICAACKVNQGHPHPLMAHVRKVDETRMRLTDAERHERNVQLTHTMQLLVHACSCNNAQCASNSCRKIRQLFQHAVSCQVKVTGGCSMCKKMWSLLSLHAKGCTQPDCPVPRCRELKELRRRQTARQEEQRRKAYQAMLRQQNAGPSRPTP